MRCVRLKWTQRLSILRCIIYLYINTKASGISRWLAVTRKWQLHYKTERSAWHPAEIEKLILRSSPKNTPLNKLFPLFFRFIVWVCVSMRVASRFGECVVGSSRENNAWKERKKKAIFFYNCAEKKKKKNRRLCCVNFILHLKFV